MSAHADGAPTRERAMIAMTALVAEHGYEATETPEILRSAGLSEQEFGSVFEGKRDCFLAVEERLADRLFERVRKAIAQPGWFPERARAALRGLTSVLAASPVLTKATTVELLRLGPEGQARHQAIVERYAELVGDAHELGELGDELPQSTPLMAVGGVAVLIFDEILAERTAELEALVPELLFVLLLPFIGPQAAAEEMRVSDRVRDAAR